MSPLCITRDSNMICYTMSVHCCTNVSIVNVLCLSHNTITRSALGGCGSTLHPYAFRALHIVPYIHNKKDATIRFCWDHVSFIFHVLNPPRIISPHISFVWVFFKAWKFHDVCYSRHVESSVFGLISVEWNTTKHSPSLVHSIHIQPLLFKLICNER